MKFTITLLPIDENINGFDLGNVTLTHEGTTIASSEHQPSQAMMVFIFLSDFIAAVCDLSANRGKNAVQVIAADSSFSLELKRNGKGISISHDNCRISLPFLTFSQTLHSDVQDWLMPLRGKISCDDPALTDLVKSLETLRAKL
ncbi:MULTISPECIES: hypothetical protein [unclassified Pseudomonas]|uniref:hypothetical protein n=1 Tax=unclassified Pseudomonas TaxID=196821 RepID=UPI000D357469|nr:MULTISPECIES: hypothetical protein [unclassified Pseudomonas]RAU45058.1 hypothetical protein DBP26_014095 [Pseudomonas sp. RIT 409]RAU51492.1 hypothetical protein DBY65_020615 [Pseudomonas sp. RIT 412]